MVSLAIELMHMSLVGSKAKALDQKETIGYMKAIDQTYDLHTQAHQELSPLLTGPPMMQMSTGEGKAKVLDEKETTVYKRALDQEYKLKLKASRSIFSEINKRYPTMPFTVRSLDSKQSRLGLVECLNHGLLHPYPVLHEKVCLNTPGIGYSQILLP